MKLGKLGKILFYANMAMIVMFLMGTEVVFDCSITFVSPAKYLLLVALLPIIPFYTAKKAFFYVSAATLIHSVILMGYLFHKRNIVMFCLTSSENVQLIVTKIGTLANENKDKMMRNNVIVILMKETASSYSVSNDETIPGTLQKKDVNKEIEKALVRIEKEIRGASKGDGRMDPFMATSSENIYIDVGNQADLKLLMGCIQRTNFSRRFHRCLLILANSAFIELETDKVEARRMIGVVDVLKAIPQASK